MQYTPDKIRKLLPHQIVVFGSNTEGRHGKGFALECKQKYGAIYGRARGLQGQSYAIVTKDLTKPKDQQAKSIPLSHIKDQVLRLYDFAKLNSDKQFLMTKIGTNLAGWTENDLNSILQEIENLRPENVLLPKFE